MNKPNRKTPEQCATGDFAVTGTEAGSVVLEANEWDRTVDSYRSVTLYLHPMEARLLAGQLARNAVEAESDGKGPH